MFSRFVAHRAGMNFNNVSDKGQAVTGARQFRIFRTSEAAGEQGGTVRLGYVMTGREDIELHPVLACPEIITNVLPAVGESLAAFPPRLGDPFGVFDRIGKKVGIHLRQQADIDNQRDLFILHIDRLIDDDAAIFKSRSEVVKLRLDDFPVHQQVCIQVTLQAVDGIADIKTGIRRFFAALKKRTDRTLQLFHFLYLFPQLPEKKFEIHVGYYDIMFDIQNEIIDKSEVPDVLPVEDPVMDVVTDTVGVFGEEEPILVGKAGDGI